MFLINSGLQTLYVAKGALWSLRVSSKCQQCNGMLPGYWDGHQTVYVPKNTRLIKHRRSFRIPRASRAPVVNQMILLQVVLWMSSVGVECLLGVSQPATLFFKSVLLCCSTHNSCAPVTEEVLAVVTGIPLQYCQQICFALRTFPSVHGLTDSDEKCFVDTVAVPSLWLHTNRLKISTILISIQVPA